jgi:hypothetical protein
MVSLYSHEDINKRLNELGCIFCGAKHLRAHQLLQHPRSEGHDAVVAKLVFTYGCRSCDAHFEVRQGRCGLAVSEERQ